MRLLLPYLVLLSLFAVACRADSVLLDGQIFGTSYHIDASASDSIDWPAVHAAINQRLSEIDSRMSTWRDDSDVSRFNQAKANNWFPVHMETVRVVALAREISEATDGAFDITVAPLVRAWNFGAASGGKFTLPSETEIASTLRRVGYNKVTIQLDPPALQKTVDGLEIDLSAIAKGYAVDAVCELLGQNAIEDFMVEIGGEIRTRGTNRDGLAWRIGLEAPDRTVRRVDSIVSLGDESLATSGDYRNFFEHNGVTYSHTIDPHTGRPINHNLAAVTVIADSCARADALATGLLSMGQDAGLAWAEANSVKAMMFSRSGENINRSKTILFPAPVGKTVERNKTASGEFFQLFLVTLAVFGIAIIAMSVGTIIANRRLQGSCGGMAGLSDSHGKTVCNMCSRPSAECSGNPAADIAKTDQADA